MVPQQREQLNYFPLTRLRIDDPFWNRYTALVTGQIIPYQWESLCDRVPDAAPSHCIRNLRIAAGLEQGDFDGFVFQDTDLAKWLEAVAFSLSYEPNPELEQTVDEMIRLLSLVQEENGYLNSYFSIRHPGQQFCNLKEGHELYTAGHFIEAAVAYWQVTGKDEFLKIMCHCADNIIRVFHSPGYEDAVPGHEEIELALFKLADATGNESYRGMALEFINRRGTSNYLSTEHQLQRFVDVWHDRNPYIPEYGQAHLPVREQTTAEGHAVRALYLYSAMADLALYYQDEGLKAACCALYENIVTKRMYITGGVGSSGVLERFTTDYDLPNDTNYAESCASIALAMFCRRMARMTGEAKYMDTAELALINTVLAGVSLDGKRFFYVNPLEVIPEACLPATDKNHVKAERQKWFGCACCPPNIARTLASLADYIFFRGEDSLWMNLFIGGDYRLSIGDTPVRLRVKSELPYEGSVFISLTAEEPVHGKVRLRIPEYAEDPHICINGSPAHWENDRGYAVLVVEGADVEIEYRFAMPARLVFAHPRVASDAGKCAVRKGALVYCLEQTDNGSNLAGLILDGNSPMTEHWNDDTLTITARGWRLDADGFGPTLYSTVPPKRQPCELRFSPYCFWGNRGPGEMSVWVRCAL